MEEAHDSALIGPHGGYRQLKSYRGAAIIYDATVRFCARFIDRRSRTTDQMVQAANTLICLIHQTNYLLDQQLRRLERDFLEEGGFTERLPHAPSPPRC